MGCKGCTDPMPIPKLRKYVHGSLGVLKALTGTGAVSRETEWYRRQICLTCEHKVAHPRYENRWIKCGLCDCLLAPKTKLATEECPDGRWPAVEPLKREKDGKNTK